MSCGSGCGCCPKCGCQATCTCNHSMTWCDHTMSDFSYIGMEAVPRENAKCGASWDVPVEICSSGNSSECLYSEVAESGNHACLDGTSATEGGICIE